MATTPWPRYAAALTLVASVAVTALFGQTVVKLPKNRYTPQ